MSEIRTNMLISGESSEYRSNIEISIVTLNSTLVDTHSSFRTNLDISTKLNDGSISSIKTNLELNNVSLRFNLVDMTKLNQSVLYFSKFFNLYFEPEVMWNLLAQGTNEQINISHLTDALSNYLTRDSVLGIEDYLDSIKETLTSHLKDDNRHFTTKEKEFLLYLMENPIQGGGGESLFEKTILGDNIPAVIPKKQEGKDAGIISNSFISCKGLDSSSSSFGSLTRNDLFGILSGPPQEGEIINLNYLVGLRELVDTYGYLKSITKNQIISALGDTPLFKSDFKDFDAVSNILQQDINNWNFIYSLIDLSEDKTYIFPKENRGIVSNSFISCKGLDETVPQIGGTFDRKSLFDILSGEPQNGESINLGFLNLSNYTTKTELNNMLQAGLGGVFTSLQSNTRTPVSVTIGGVTKTIEQSTLRKSLGLGTAAYESKDTFATQAALNDTDAEVDEHTRVVNTLQQTLAQATAIITNLQSRLNKVEDWGFQFTMTSQGSRVLVTPHNFVSDGSISCLGLANNEEFEQKIVLITQEEYDKLVASGQVNETKIYYVY